MNVYLLNKEIHFDRFHVMQKLTATSVKAKSFEMKAVTFLRSIFRMLRGLFQITHSMSINTVVPIVTSGHHRLFNKSNIYQAILLTVDCIDKIGKVQSYIWLNPSLRKSLPRLVQS